MFTRQDFFVIVMFTRQDFFVIVIVMFTRQDFFVIVIHASRLFRPVARRTRERDARFARDDGDDDAED